ncbi:class I SAM-dependent DNA methyltransferase [Mycolicibacterium arseniciresistens]|uniref:Class I SAM-dependent methyltransferase n=1 Tax=Mycolicibacterium arseniciresistens TaxID=3062257 RepID=A0ABT8UQU7_9MYCO|nr:class I SAM-dependent methyltransferase [Mycolicibacterium arseniciresistens]MDO3640164.1 class I SAM-dependent methyltransferase [Mycolicibacterium arseniciresistens]
MSTRWQRTDAPRGDDYDSRWRSLAAEGRNVHGEADLVSALLAEHGGSRVLDAGCGTGRVAIALAERGHTVVGVDVDAGMLSAARAKQPALTWIEADLADLGAHLRDVFDLAVMAGNVMIFVEPGTEGRVLGAVADRLAAGGLLVAGFQIRPDRLSVADYDRLAESAGLQPVARWATWDREPFTGGDYAVSMHRRG